MSQSPYASTHVRDSGPHKFTTDSYVHAHDLGMVDCVLCGGKFSDAIHHADEPDLWPE